MPKGKARGSSDLLAEYNAKRDFDATPEPAGRVDATNDGEARFVVQEHRARALHWDLRLERDGVLASWAVPKGIPPDPRRNHLAVQTEDHPMEYLTFHGEIPKGEYGGGTMRVFDHGTYETHKWSDREVMITFHGEQVRGKYVLFRTRGKDWMIHRMDPPEDAARELAPEGLRPMAASAGAAPTGAGWAWELKWDGIRALGYADGGRLRLFTRNGNEVTKRWPELRQLAVELGARDAVFDGEIVTFDEHGRPSFETLQRRMHVDAESQIRRLQHEVPAVYILFDLLWLDGHSLMGLAYEDRRAQLVELGLTGASWQTPPNEVGDGAATIDVSQRFGLEGVVAKRVTSIYEPGKRSKAWIKVKNTLRQEFVVGGWMPGEGNRDGSIGSLVVGYYDDVDGEPQLHYAGRVGSGLSHADLTELERCFAEYPRDTSPFAVGTPPRQARWVEPMLVVEVRFTEWTKAGTLRQPSFLGYRTDKSALDVVRET